MTDWKEALKSLSRRVVKRDIIDIMSYNSIISTPTNKHLLSTDNKENTPRITKLSPAIRNILQIDSVGSPLSPSKKKELIQNSRNTRSLSNTSSNKGSSNGSLPKSPYKRLVTGFTPAVSRWSFAASEQRQRQKIRSKFYKSSIFYLQSLYNLYNNYKYFILIL